MSLGGIRIPVTKLVGLLTLVLFISAPASAGFLINEMLINGPGGDDGQEFIELISDTAGVESLDGLTIMQIEGDGGGSGQIDRVYSFSGVSSGVNGLFLFRDSSDGLEPAADAQTTVFVEPDTQTLFDDDLENGSGTIVLVQGFTGALDDDLDTDDDGTLDSTPWGNVVDAVGWPENDSGNENAYAAQLGGFQTPNTIGFAPDAFVREGNGGFFMEVDDIEEHRDFEQ